MSQHCLSFRRSSSILFGLLTSWLVTAAGWSQELIPPVMPSSSNIQADLDAQTAAVWSALTELGRGVRDLDKTKDNLFVYQEETARLQAEAARLVGSPAELTLRVQRVTAKEVVVDVPDAGSTRIVIRHASPPEFGNLCTVEQRDGYSSTAWYNQFAQPFALRIGSEIDLGLARQLRRQDELILNGQIISVVVRTEAIFRPVAVATLGNWYVTKTPTQSDE